MYPIDIKSVDVSVIIVNYNYGKLIRRCIRSLLNQDLPKDKFEIVVVDDCSTDDSVQALETFVNEGEIRLFESDKNLGTGGGAQIGVAHSHGKYFIRVDSDDYV